MEEKHERASRHWHTGVEKITETLHKPHEAVKKVDAFSFEAKPATTVGGVITLFVWAATIAYAGFIAYDYGSRPYVQTSEIEWTQGSGPYPMNLTCKTSSGCYVSNLFRDKYNPLINQTELGCVKLAANESMVLHTLYAALPFDGLSVVYNPNDTDSSLPAEFGAIVTSEARCWPDRYPDCVQGVVKILTPVGPGLSQANYVNTINQSRSDAGGNRHEWFLSRMTENGQVVPQTSSCEGRIGAANLPSYVQSRIILHCYWIRVNVFRENYWLGLWGTCGGAYGLCLQLGAYILATVNLWLWATQRGVPPEEKEDSTAMQRLGSLITGRLGSIIGAGKHAGHDIGSRQHSMASKAMMAHFRNKDAANHVEMGVPSPMHKAPVRVWPVSGEGESRSLPNLAREST